MALLERLRVESLAAEQPADLWLVLLQRVRGKVEFDGLERVSSQTLLDMLEVPQRSRTAGTYRRLGGIMAELGWAECGSAIRRAAGTRSKFVATSATGDVPATADQNALAASFGPQAYSLASSCHLRPSKARPNLSSTRQCTGVAVRRRYRPPTGKISDFDRLISFTMACCFC
jgi:hypothetical protein